LQQNKTVCFDKQFKKAFLQLQVTFGNCFEIAFKQKIAIRHLTKGFRDKLEEALKLQIC